MAGPKLLAIVRCALAAALAATFAFALAPSPNMHPSSGGDKILHFAAFYVLTVLGVLAAPRLSPWTIAGSFLAIGIGIELLQGLPIVGRDCDWRDVVADMAGVFAVLLPLVLARIRGRLAA